MLSVYFFNIVSLSSTSLRLIMYTCADDDEVLTLLFVGSPSNKRRKSHGSINRDVTRSCDIMMDLLL